MPDEIRAVSDEAEPDARNLSLRDSAEYESKVLSSLPPSDPQILRRLSEATSAGDTARMVDSVRAGWFDLIVERNPKLLEVVGSFSPDMLRSSPLLSMLAGVLYHRIPHRRLKGIRLFVGATRAAASDRRAMDAVDRILVLTSAAASYRLIGRAALGAKPARTALRILREMPDTDRKQLHAMPRLYSQLGTTLYYGGHAEEALGVFELGRAEIPRVGYPHGYMNLAMLAGIHALQGDIRQGQKYLETARSPKWPEATRSTYTGAFYRLAEATTALEQFDAKTARYHLDAMVYGRATIEHWVPIALTEAVTSLVAGNPGVASAELEAFAAHRQAEGRTASARKQLAATRSLIELALGRPEAAVAILRRDGAPGAEREIARARADLVLGHHSVALQRLRRISRASLTTRMATELLVLEAACLLRFANWSPTRSALESLGGILERSGVRLPLALVPASDAARVQSALEATGFGHVLPSSGVVAVIPDSDGEGVLSEREHAVLRALVRTPSNAAIAAELVVSVNTVKTQLRSIYRKLGVRTRDEAIAVALARHLVSVQSDTSSEQR